MNVLPFNFEFLDSDIALLTNQAGFHAYLSRMELNSLIDKTPPMMLSSMSCLKESSLFVMTNTNLLRLALSLRVCQNA